MSLKQFTQTHTHTQSFSYIQKEQEEQNYKALRDPHWKVLYIRMQIKRPTPMPGKVRKTMIQLGGLHASSSDAA